MAVHSDDKLPPLRALGGWIRGVLFGARVSREDDSPAFKKTSLPAASRPYNLRKQRLPNLLTSADWNRALEYWDFKCAVCERPRGLWHTLAQDHWIPLTDPNCPGTVAENILPLCHGESGCNNSKGKKSPDTWLRDKLGARRAGQKRREIEAFFAWARERADRRSGCPKCGSVVDYDAAQALWQCTACGAAWGDDFVHDMANCPTCNCWMLPDGRRTPTYTCPRCDTIWPEADLPLERCPGCGRGVLRWQEEATDPDGGYWMCITCGAEWVDDADDLQ